MAGKKTEKEEVVPEVNEEQVLDEENFEDLDALFSSADALLDESLYDVEYDREVFMELRKMLDAAYLKRKRSDADEKEYDDMVFNLTTKAIDDANLQDFLGYCYKKGKYDFCLQNFDKYLKWTILAAANGNAFSISKLQMFYTSQLDNLLSQNFNPIVMDNFELDYDKYVFIMLKKLCFQTAKILELDSLKLIKEPEVTLEQNEQLMRKYDSIKNQAADLVRKEYEEVAESIKQLDEEIEKRDQQEKTNRKKVEEEEIEEKTEISENNVEEEAAKELGSNKFVNRVSKKKFRW